MLRHDLNRWTTDDGKLNQGKYKGEPSTRLYNLDLTLSEDAASSQNNLERFPYRYPPGCSYGFGKKKIMRSPVPKLNSGLKSIVAFWCLYRAPESGTASIDQKIRNLLREDFHFLKKGTTRSIDVSELRHKLDS